MPAFEQFMAIMQEKRILGRAIEIQKQNRVQRGIFQR